MGGVDKIYLLGPLSKLFWLIKTFKRILDNVQKDISFQWYILTLKQWCESTYE